MGDSHLCPRCDVETEYVLTQWHEETIGVVNQMWCPECFSMYAVPREWYDDD